MFENTMPPQCERCGRGIVFVKHIRTLKAAPIDAVPTPGGDRLIDWATMTYRVIAKEDLAKYPGQLHKAHQATCVRVPVGSRR